MLQDDKAGWLLTTLGYRHKGPHIQFPDLVLIQNLASQASFLGDLLGLFSHVFRCVGISWMIDQVPYPTNGQGNNLTGFSSRFNLAHSSTFPFYQTDSFYLFQFVFISGLIFLELISPQHTSFYSSLGGCRDTDSGIFYIREYSRKAFYSQFL